MSLASKIEQIKNDMPIVYETGKTVGYNEGYQKGLDKANGSLVLDGVDLGRPLLTWREFINSSRNTIGLKIHDSDGMELVYTADDRPVYINNDWGTFNSYSDDIIDPSINQYYI